MTMKFLITAALWFLFLKNEFHLHQNVAPLVESSIVIIWKNCRLSKV